MPSKRKDMILALVSLIYKKRSFFICTLSIVISTIETFAQKPEEAFTFWAKVTGDFIINAHGGIKTGYTYVGMEEFSIDFNTRAAGWWKSGNFYIHCLNTHGVGASESLTGDQQVLSNIEAGDFTGIYELYYNHELEKLSLLAGIHNLNSEFAESRYGGTFLNSSFGIVPNISLNMPVSIYPLAAPCLLGKYKASGKWNIKMAVYDGDPGNLETNRFNLHWRINSKEGFFSIIQNEYKRTVSEHINGIYKLGVYFHSGSFLSYRDTTFHHKGNYGIYMVIDQALFNRSLNSGRGLCFFFQGGLSPHEFNQISTYIGGGLRYHGLLSNRFYDEIGLAVASIWASHHFQDVYAVKKKAETSMEATYKFAFKDKLTIQPCVQYVINPSFGGYPNCMVFILRFSLEY